MGKLRQMTALYLTDGDRILLLYRIGSKIADHSYIGCAGGHFEAEDCSNARSCILRELREEMGMEPEMIENLTLRYITMRLKNGEIRQNYYFFAQAKQLPDPLTSTEGILEWHTLDEISGLPMPVSAKHVLLHYRSQGRHDTLLRGGMTCECGTDFTVLREF